MRLRVAGRASEGQPSSRAGDFFVPFEDVWVEDLEIKVVLPEGCSDVKL